MSLRRAPTNDGKFEAVRVAHSERCGKKVYAKRKLAATVAAKSRRDTGEMIYAYHCEKGCGGWHIGHPPYSVYKKIVGMDAHQPPA